MRARILDGGLSKARAGQVVADLEDDRPWNSVLDYIRALAALSALYPEEMKRKTYVQGRPIRRILWCAAAADRVQWLFNGCRLRRAVEPKMLSLLGSGTSPNESLHAELNRWFKNQPEVFSTTLGLQLSVCQLGKLLSHGAAMYRPTLRQMDQQSILHVCSQAIVFSRGSWQEFCSRLSQDEPVLQAAALPMATERKRISAKIQSCVKKRPATVTKRPAAHFKRTPFTLKRARGL